MRSFIFHLICLPISIAMLVS